MALRAPPACLYDSLEQAEATCKAFAADHGYALVRKRSKTSKATASAAGEFRKVWLRCDKGRKRQQINYKRATSSRMTECPFQLTIGFKEMELSGTIFNPQTIQIL
ncbi:hypothetical protein K402DRAFT_463036 [Aulographum hederae CBS 113979]|uniref:FAR1 domain-containing protein n=1 Tax=Aulographum hederae CBS 113979 TaxID=1176131 RepID=A0A6G1H2R1_9PEZI|nr:hypothetical protein K402DRAFT_463036 [Aulographum hederae CBS 113979]